MTQAACRLVVVAVVLSCAAPALGQDDSAAGWVRTATGSAWIVRSGESLPVQVGDAIKEADTLKTGANGHLGVTMQDDTRLSIGPESELSLDQFSFSPSDGRLALAVRIVRGIAAYVSGQIARLSPDAVRLETPAAIVGVRGTTLVFQVEPE